MLPILTTTQKTFTTKKPYKTAAAVVGLTAFAAKRIWVANQSEYIVRKGFGIQDVQFRKIAVQWPFQTAARLDISPFLISSQISGKADQNKVVSAQMNWTIAPKNDEESLKDYLLALELFKGNSQVQKFVQKIVDERASRLSTYWMLKSLLLDQDKFKEYAIPIINSDIRSEGLEVQNLTISNMTSVQDCDLIRFYYFWNNNND